MNWKMIPCVIYQTQGQMTKKQLKTQHTHIYKMLYCFELCCHLINAQWVDRICCLVRKYISQSYSVVPTADVLIKRTDDCTRPRQNRISGAVGKEYAWILKASELIAQNELKSSDIVTWAGFSSSLLPAESVKPKANIGILPLFPDKAASVAMVKYAMLLGKAVTEHLNPGQTPVQGMDQPMYAIAWSRYSGRRLTNLERTRLY